MLFPAAGLLVLLGCVFGASCFQGVSTTDPPCAKLVCSGRNCVLLNRCFSDVDVLVLMSWLVNQNSSARSPRWRRFSTPVKGPIGSTLKGKRELESLCRLLTSLFCSASTSADWEDSPPTRALACSRGLGSFKKERQWKFHSESTTSVRYVRNCGASPIRLPHRPLCAS